MKHVVFETKLKNQAQGLFIHIPDASVMSFEFSFRAGEYLMPKPKFEVPHIMEHLLLGANKLIPRSRDFQAEFEKNGAYCNASTGTYDVGYEAECADFEWDRIASLLLVAITQPLFLEDEFVAESGNVREELIGRSNNHFRHLSLALRKAYGFYSLTDQERLELMHNVVLEDISKHYERTHSTSNLRFVIAGSLPKARRDQIEELIEKMLLPKGEGRLDLPSEMPKRLTKPLYIENDTVKNLYFYLDTFLMRRLKNPEIDALQLFNIMMTETLYSKILGTARERGLVYGMSSGFGQTKEASNWWLGTQVSVKNAPILFEIISHELKEVLRGRLLVGDIKSAQQYALGRYQRSGQTVSGTAAGYSSRYFFDGVVDDYYKIPERIKSVTKTSIAGITKNLFSDKLWGLGILGDCGGDLVKELQSTVQPLWK